jgi:uncharacterized protein YraI
MFSKILAATALCGTMLVPAIASAATTAFTTSDLNIRTGPGASYQRFDTIPHGGSVTVYGCLSGYNWCDVSWAGNRGWVSGNYLAYAGPRYRSRPITSIGVTIGLPIFNFEPFAYHGRHYADRSWYRDRYLNRGEASQERRELRQEQRDVRQEKREVRDQRDDVRDARRDLNQARQAGEDVRQPRRELRQERRELGAARKDLRQERRELWRERRD